jgi:hypothetical protein
MKWGSLVLEPNIYGVCLFQYRLQDLGTAGILAALSERCATSGQRWQKNNVAEDHVALYGGVRRQWNGVAWC